MPPTSAAAGMPAMAKQSTPKTMSNRLATMKFMQRGAAAAAAAAAATRTLETSSPATPRSDDSSAKRRKFAHTPTAASPSAAAFYDHQAIKAAVDEENKRNQAAVEKRAAELGDSHWVLEGAANLPARGSRPLLNVVQVGFTEIDGAGTPGDDDDPFDLGTRAPAQPQFLRFNMKKSKAVVTKEDHRSGSGDSDSGSGSESGEASEDERPRPPAKDEPARGRRNTVGDAERKRARSSVSNRREEERRKAQQLAGMRRKKEIKLNQLTSISSAGSQAFQRPSTTLSCHGCGKPGHKVADCPNKKR